MATTTGGTTYVTSTDLVADYPTASLALANRVDVVASGGSNNTKTSSYTITLADILEGDKFLYNSASPGTFTLPTSGLVDGMVVQIAQIGAGAASVTGGTIVGTTSTSAQYQGLRLIYASTGTTWYSVAPSVAAPGFSLITPTSIANSGGSATASGGQVTFSGVTSVSLNGVFSATYDAYRVVLNVSATAGTAASIRLRAAGTDASGSNYGRFGYVGGATNANVNGTGETSWVTYSDLPGFLTIDLYGPFLSTVTRGFMNALESNDTRGLMQGLTHSLTTSYDGLTITRTGGTATTGTVRIYGYRNS